MHDHTSADRGRSQEDRAQRWIAILRDGDPDAKAEARRGLAGVFEARGMHAEAAELLVANARAGYRDAALFRTLARLYRELGDEYLSASAALEATRLSFGEPPAAPPPPGQPPSAPDDRLSGHFEPAARADDPGAPTDDHHDPTNVPNEPTPNPVTAQPAPRATPRRPAAWWRTALRVLGWLTVVATVSGSAAVGQRSPASAVLYGLSAMLLAVLLSRSSALRRLIFVPDGPLGDGALLFSWLLTLLAAGALLPRAPEPTQPISPFPATATPLVATVAPSPTVDPTRASSPAPVMTVMVAPAAAPPAGVPSPDASPSPLPQVLGIASPAAATAPIPTPSPPSLILVVIRAGTDGVRLRDAPGLGDALKVLMNGARLEWLGEDRQVDGRSWRHVRDPDGTEGWISAELVAAAQELSAEASAMGTPTRTVFQPASVGSAAAKPSTDGAGRAAPQGSACPSSHPIKGNQSASGAWIYHLPSGAFYSRTNPEACFATEADARAAGYRASQR